MKVQKEGRRICLRRGEKKGITSIYIS